MQCCWLSQYRQTPTFTEHTFLKNDANVESANVGALFQWEWGGWVPGGKWFMKEIFKILQTRMQIISFIQKSYQIKKTFQMLFMILHDITFDVMMLWWWWVRIQWMPLKRMQVRVLMSQALKWVQVTALKGMQVRVRVSRSRQRHEKKEWDQVHAVHK